MILIDTCVLLWLSYDPSQLSQRAIECMEKSKKRYLSSISFLEIGLKVRDGQVRLPLPFPTWYSQIMEHLGFDEIEVNASIAFLSTQLPPIHRDPFDRVITATAILADFTLITPDRHIASYPDVQTLW